MSQNKFHIVNLKTNLHKFFRKLFTDKFALTVLLYGLLLAGLAFLLKFFEYRYFVRDLSVEIYIGLVATLFTAIGIWVGLKLVNKKTTTPSQILSIDEAAIKFYNISKREYEVLELISKGLSNQEIADQLFISLPTVKTHSSNLFEKLDVKRRTQAVVKAKQLKIIV